MLSLADKETIIEHLPQLIGNMKTDPICDHLRSSKVLTEMDVEDITAERTTSAKNRKMLYIILKGKKDDKLHLIAALNKAEQTQLADLLQHGKSHNSVLVRFKTTNPFSLPFTYNIENTWVSLALKENTNHTEATEDHAKLLEQAFMKEKMLVIEGKPGTGKTSLMRRLAYEWAREKPELTHYDLIMYAEFREVRNDKFTHISELVTSYLQRYVGRDNSMGLRNIVTDAEWFEDNHKLLVLLDGFDESIKKQCTELDRYLTNVTIDRRLLFDIVVTTRPGYLPAELKGRDGRFVFAEVLGFTTDEQKMKYISNHFSKPEKGVEAESIHLLLKSKEVQEVTTTKQKDVYISNRLKNTEMDAIKGEALAVYVMLQSNRSLRELAETPLFLTFICLVNKQIINGTLLDLYCNIVRWLLDRHQNIHQDRMDVPSLCEYHPESSSSELRKNTIINKYYLHFPQLQNLGNMALNNLERNIFLQSDLENFNIHPIVQEVGLLRKDEKFDQDSISTTEFSFLHRSIQEFLAAFSYLVRKQTQGVDNFMAHKIFKRSIQGTSREHERMSEFEKFLWRIATSEKLPISPEMKLHFFQSYSTLMLDLDIFSSSAEISFEHLKTYLGKCSNITRLYLNLNSMMFDCQLTFTNLAASGEMDFHGCTFQENSQLTFTNFPALGKMTFVGCTFQLNSQLTFTNLPALNVMHFSKCTFQENSQLTFTNLPALENMTFFDCTFQENLQLTFTNLPALNKMIFGGSYVGCIFQENSQLTFTNLPVLKEIHFYGGTFQPNSQLTFTNLSALEKMNFEYLCVFQENSHFTFTNLSALNKMSFHGTFQANSQLTFTNLAASGEMDFHGCTFQENSQLTLTNLPASGKMTFNHCTFQPNSQLTLSNLPASGKMTFNHCTFQPNSQLTFTVNNFSLSGKGEFRATFHEISEQNRCN